MTDTQQPTNPARPMPQAPPLGGQPLPQRQNGPQTVRIPVTSLVNPPHRPTLKGVPTEETPEEPWQEKEFDPDEDSGDDPAPEPRASAPLPLRRTLSASEHPDAPDAPGGAGGSGQAAAPIQLPPRPAFARAGSQAQAHEGSERNPRGESRPELPTRAGQSAAQAAPAGGQARPSLPIRTRGESNPLAGHRSSAPAASSSGRPALPRTGAENGSGTQAVSGSGRPVLPRMELKPVLPVDPEKSGLNVIPVPARVLAPPPPASAGGGQPEPAAPARFTPQNLALRKDIAPAAPPSAPEKDPPTAFRASAANNPSGPAPELSVVLEHLVNLPDQTAILGVCDDHLPVLLDLGDPASGALLVASDDEILRERLMRTLLQTAAALNSPRSVQFLILSSHPADWQAWLDGLDAVRHCLGVDSLVEGSPARWLLKLAGWADQRRTGTSNGPAVILVVDDLAAVSQLEYDARVNFDWLVKEGPGVRIWPVVGMAVERAPELVRWVRLFKTRILGPARDASLYRQLAALDAQESSTLLQADQFAVRIQEDWLKFRVPTLPGETE